MPGLLAAPDGAERRFLMLWTGAWLAGLAASLGAHESLALFRTWIEPGLSPETRFRIQDFGPSIELVLYPVLAVLAPVLCWLTLRPLYPRPSLGAWLGWMALSVTVVLGLMIVLVTTVLVDVETAEDIQPGPFVIMLVFLTDLMVKGGYMLAFLALARRVGFTICIGFVCATLFLVATGASTMTNDFHDAIETIDEYSDWGQSVDWTWVPALMFEAVVLGVASGLAIIIGFRWHARDVEATVFD